MMSIEWAQNYRNPMSYDKLCTLILAQIIYPFMQMIWINIKKDVFNKI